MRRVATAMSVVAALAVLTVPWAAPGAAKPTATAPTTKGGKATTTTSSTSTSTTSTSTTSTSTTSTTSSTTSTTVATAPAGTCDVPAVRTVDVATTSALQAALAGALPGDLIRLADGVYAGRFTVAVSGTETQRIQLCGGAGAILDAGSTTAGYGLHLNRANHWDVRGITVRNAQKGVMLDASSFNVLSGLTVHTIGDEAVHLRKASTKNRVENSTISDTGRREPAFGEGVYVGSANNNWCTYTNCLPDASDGNVIAGNTILRTTAEAIDIKEGTTGGLIEGNSFDGSGMVSPSWVDIKGNNWVVKNNSGRVSPRDGFLTSIALTGWGVGSTFSGNHADVQGPGYGYNVKVGNSVGCDNTVANAVKGLSNVVCTIL